MDGERVSKWDIVSSSEDDDAGLPCIQSYARDVLREKAANNDFGPDWPEEILRKWQRSDFGGAASFRYQQELSAMNVKLDGIRNELSQALGQPKNNHKSNDIVNQVIEFSVNDTLYSTK